VHDHPLLHHKLASLRRPETDTPNFRARLGEVAGLMVWAATRDLPTRAVEVRTPLETTMGHELACPVTVVPVLRAGLGMSEGVLHVMPEARIGHLGMARDEETLQPRTYLRRLPADLDAGPVFLVDPMLATGGSAVAAARVLRKAGARSLRFVGLVAAPAGVVRLLESDPDITVHLATIDRQLDARGFILPGLGDAGDRAFGTD
jgi:uracil phosphoribosyltransferase